MNHNNGVVKRGSAASICICTWIILLLDPIYWIYYPKSLQVYNFHGYNVLEGTVLFGYKKSTLQEGYFSMFCGSYSREVLICGFLLYWIQCSLGNFICQFLIREHLAHDTNVDKSKIPLDTKKNVMFAKQSLKHFHYLLVAYDRNFCIYIWNWNRDGVFPAIWVDFSSQDK